MFSSDSYDSSNVTALAWLLYDWCLISAVLVWLPNHVYLRTGALTYKFLTESIYDKNAMRIQTHFIQIRTN